MFIKTVSTTSGINPIKFDETGGVFYWILNTGSSTVYASTKSAFTAGDDGVVSLGPKESRRLETNNDTIYILGEGQVEIHNQRDGICSFKQAPTSSGGGGTVDAYTKTESDAKYAQKTDIPTSLPANGGNADYATNAGNADKLDGKYASDFADNIYKGYPDKGNCNNATAQGVYSVSHNSQNAPDANYYLLTVDVAGDGAWMVQTAFPVTYESNAYRRMYVNGVWGAWYNLTPIKSTGGVTSPTDQYGTIILPNGSTRRYLSIAAVGYYAEMFLFNDEYTVRIVNENYERVINTPVTYIAFYIE